MAAPLPFAATGTFPMACRKFARCVLAAC